MKFTCETVQPLLCSYLDGELSEAQARPTRAHLLDCLACRETVQEGKVIRRWLADAREDVEVPRGFSARVTRRAFAGDPGLLVPASPPIGLRVAGPPSLLPFILKLSAVAAAVLFFFSLLIQRTSLPAGDDLQASDRSWMFEPAEVEAPVPALEEDVSGTAEEAEDAEDSAEDAESTDR